MPEPMRYAVLLDKPEQLAFGEMAEAIARIQEVPVQDAALPARHCWGIIAEGVEKASGARAVELLGRTGLSALMIPVSLIEDLPPPQILSKVEPGKEGLQAWPELWCPWSAVELIASAGYQKAKKVRLLGPPNPKRRPAVAPRQETELVFLLDVLIQEPSGRRRLRVDAEDFDYSGLKKALSYGAFSNFRRLLLALADRAPQALRNRGTETLLDHKPVREMGYESPRDLEQESRWLLTLRALNRL